MSPLPGIGSTSLRAACGVLLWRYGWWPVIAGVALLAAVMVRVMWLAPSQDEWAVVQRALNTPLPAVQRVAVDNKVLADERNHAAFVAVLAPYRSQAEAVRQVVAATRPELEWTYAEFQHTSDAATGVVRLQVDVPAAGDYRRLRKALERALRLVPNLSLDQVAFERDDVARPQVNARLKLSLWLRAHARNASVSVAAAEGERR